ncbi:hypothetical protein DYI26_01560 [Halomonas litopenaei]|nr:hypothetical protein [Halomonas litopenaei]
MNRAREEVSGERAHPSGGAATPLQEGIDTGGAGPATSTQASFGRSAFICCKPLQFLTCASIVRHYRIEQALVLLVAESIAEYDAFYAFVEASHHRSLFDEIRRVPTQAAAREALGALHYDSLFIDNDRTSKYLLLAPLKTGCLCLYEEGVSTYFSSYLYEMPLSRRLKWSLVALVRGCGLRFGGGRRTDLVFVSRPRTYARLNPRLAHKARYCPGLVGELEQGWEDWQALLSPWLDRLTSATPALVLGTWGGGDISAERLAELKRRHPLLLFKPHPHDGCAWLDADIQVLEQPWIPAEVWIRLLASRVDELVVYHYSSSSELYCLDLLDRVTFVDLKGDVHIRRVCDLAVGDPGHDDIDHVAIA